MFGGLYINVYVSSIIVFTHKRAMKNQKEITELETPMFEAEKDLFRKILALRMKLDSSSRREAFEKLSNMWCSKLNIAKLKSIV